MYVKVLEKEIFKPSFSVKFSKDKLKFSDPPLPPRPGSGAGRGFRVGVRQLVVSEPRDKFPWAYR